MRYSIKIEDNCFVFRGIGRLSLSDLIIDYEGGSARADYIFTLFLHASRQKDYGSCPPSECLVCEAKITKQLKV